MSEEQAIENIGKSRFKKRSLTPEQVALDKLRSAITPRIPEDRRNEYLERVSQLPNLRYMNMDRLATAIVLVDRIYENIGSYSPSPLQYGAAERGLVGGSPDDPNVRRTRENLFSYSTIITRLMTEGSL
uniref:Uncharacterized protein n=1 Tax=viral metagenome TaxID=1070528 RepID=A0A6C0BNC8_9ZZZZ